MIVRNWILLTVDGLRFERPHQRRFTLGSWLCSWLCGWLCSWLCSWLERLTFSEEVTRSTNSLVRPICPSASVAVQLAAQLAVQLAVPLAVQRH